MSILKNPSWRLLGPVFLRVDWRHRYWFSSRKTALRWLGLAFLADILAQTTVGQAGIWAMLATAVTVVALSFLPPRLSAAIGGLMVTQALVSIGLVLGLFALGWSKGWREGILLVWAVWCMVAVALLAVRYVRTPRSQMPDA